MLTFDKVFRIVIVVAIMCIVIRVFLSVLM